MLNSRVAGRYAEPILELAESMGVLDSVKSDMETFVAICEESREFSLMLKSPIISNQRKAQILKKIFTGKINKITLQAFEVIIRKNREKILEDISGEFLRLYNVRKGYVEVSVTTSFKLDTEVREEFEKLAKDITHKKPILKEIVKPEIVGGYILKFDDSQIDNSISGKLKELRFKFLRSITLKPTT